MTVRLIQIGMGGWGRSWAKNILPANKDVATVAYVDTVPEMLTRTQQDLSVPTDRCFSSLEEALTAYEADAVLITSSLAAHAPVALTALHAGKHVLLEKPFASSLAEARQVVELAAQRERILMISQNYRFFPAVQAVKQLIQAGTLGFIGSINIDFRRYDNTLPRDSNHPHYAFWEPLLVDMAIHHFDLMCFLLGQRPLSVTSQTWNPPWSKYRDPAVGTATITFDGGTVVSYRGNWVSPGTKTSWSGEWHMDCEGGEVIWSSRLDNEQPDNLMLRLLGKRIRRLPLPEIPLRDRHGSLNAFVQAVQMGQEPESSGRDNLKTLALLFGAVEAAASGKPVTLLQTERISS